MLENGLKPEDYKFVGINGLSDNDAAFYSAIRYTATPGTPLVIYPKDIVLSSGSGGKSHITAQLTGTPEEEARKKAEAERLKAEAEARQQAEDAAKKRAAEEAKARQAYEFQMGDDDEFVRMLGIVNTVNRAKEDPKAIAARAKDAADALKNPFSRIIENLALIEHHTRPLDEDYTPPAGLGHGIRRGLGSGRSYRRSLGGALGGADLDFDSSYEVNQIVNEAIIFTSHLKPDHASYLKVVEYITATVQTVSNSNMSRSDKEDAIRQLYGVMGVFQKASQGAIEASQAENKADEEALKEAVEGAQEASQEAAEQIAENALTPEEKKNSQLDKFMSNFKGLKKHSGRAVKGAILGAILGPGGPLVGAAVGAAAGILTSKVDFKSFVFGSRSVDKDGNVHVKTGILGQWSNMFKASLIPHMKTIGEDLKDSLKESFSTAFEPITIALKKSKADKKIGGMLDMIEDKVGGVVNAVLHPIKFANGLLVQTVDRLLTGGISAAGSLLGTGIRTVGKASGFLTNHIGDIFGSKTSKANLKAQKELRGVRSENFFGDLSSSFKEGGIKGIFGTGRRMADKEMARYQQMLSEVDTSTTEGKAKERELKALMASADRRGTGAKENKLYDKSMRQLARKYNFSAGKMTDKQMEYAKKRLSEHMTKDNDDFEFWNTFKDKMTGEQLRRYIIGDSTVKDELKANAAAEAKEKTEHNYRTSVLGFMSGILHWLTGDKKADVVDPDKTTGEAVVAQINSDMTSASEKQEAAAADADAAKKREAAVQKEKAEHKATVAAGAAHADATPDDQADSGITEEEMEGSRANAVGENDGLFGDSDEEGGGGIFGFFKNIFGGMSSSGLLGAGAVGLLLGTEAGRDITGKILGAVGPLISNVGEKLLGWAGDAMADLGKDIKDKVTTFGKSLIPGTKENQKATKNGNLSAAQLADIDPSLVSGAVDNGDGTMTIGTNSNRGTWLRDTLYKGASHFIRKGPGATLNNLKAGTKLVGKGLAFGAKALSVPVKLATKGIGKTVGAIGKGGATLLKKGIEGASSLSGKAAEKIAASGAKGGVMGKVKSILEGMKKTLDSLTGNKNIVTALEGTGAKPQGFLSKITSYLDDAIKKLTSKADDMAKGFGSKIDDVYQKFIGSTAGSVIKAAAIVFTTAWGAFNGWQDTAKLFEVNEEDVDGLMRTISIIFRIFLDTSAFIGAGLELLDIIYEGIFGKSFIKTLANGLYNFLFSFTGKKAKGDKSLDEKQNAFIAEYEKYLKDNNLTKEEMPFADYNALKNATLVDKAGNWIGSKFNAVKTAITEWWKGPTVQKSENATTSPVGAGFKTKGGKSRGGGAGSLTRNAGAGLGGTISQYDPKFANRVYGQGRGTVQSDGCGLVAIANAKEALGGAADILDQVGRAERRAGGLNNRTNQVNLRGYSPQALGPLGMTATELHSVDEIRKNLENGTPVNIAGMGGLGGGLYGGPGNSHIVNALGYNPDGTIRVQDGKGVVNVSEDELFNGAHHAFAMGLGGRPMNAMSVSDGKSKSGKPSGSYTASNKKGTGTAAKTGSAGNGAANNATEIVGEPLQAGNGVNVTNGMYYFAQSDPRWRDQTLSGYTSTLHHTGCVLTSAAMGVASLLGDPTLTPDVINKYGNGNVGSTKFDALGIKVERVPPGGNGNVDADPAAYQQQIMAALKAGMPVMLYGTKTANNVYYDGTTGTNHCVLATGIDENGNILINNPWANGNGTRPVGTEGVSWTFDQLRPFHWAQIMSYNGKGVSGRRADGVVTGDYTTPGSGNYVSGTIGTSGVSGAAASGASDSSSTMQGATDSSSNSANSASGEEEEKKPGPLDAFAAFGTAMSNAASDVLGAVMSGRSYKEVRAERKAREAEEEAAANETMGAGLGGAARAGKKNPNIKIKGAKAVKPKSMYIVNNRGEFEEVGRETTSVSPEDMLRIVVRDVEAVRALVDLIHP